MLTRTRHYLAMNVYWFGLAFLWNGLHPIILPALLLQFVPDSLKNTYLGSLTFVGLILAMVIQPLAGAFSDRTHSRWGRRRPWILAGTLFSLVFLAGMALAGSLWGLLLSLPASCLQHSPRPCPGAHSRSRTQRPARSRLWHQEPL
jgi:MFS family permease